MPNRCSFASADVLLSAPGTSFAAWEKTIPGGFELKDEGARALEAVQLPPKFTLRQVVPTFTLPDASGRQISIWGYKGRRNLVLYFFNAKSANARDLLVAFAAAYPRHRDLEAEVIAVASGPLPTVRALAEQLRPPFPLLADSTGEVSARYTHRRQGTGETVPAVFVTDRYGALYYQAIAPRDAELPSQDQILDWLLFVGIQCEECGVPEWPRE